MEQPNLEDKVGFISNIGKKLRNSRFYQTGVGIIASLGLYSALNGDVNRAYASEEPSLMAQEYPSWTESQPYERGKEKISDDENPLKTEDCEERATRTINLAYKTMNKLPLPQDLKTIVYRMLALESLDAIEECKKQETK